MGNTYWYLHVFLCSFYSAEHDQPLQIPPAAEAVKNNHCRQASSWRIIFAKNYSRALYPLSYPLQYFQGVSVRIPFSDCFIGLQSYAFPPPASTPPGHQQRVFSCFSQSSSAHVSKKLDKRAAACLN